MSLVDPVSAKALSANRNGVESLRPLFRPRGVAVIGASRDPQRIGRQLLDSMIQSAFPGQIFPVNPAGGTIAGRPAYHSIAEIPVTFDLAVIAVPHASVLSVVDECATKGVPALLVISAGFAEAGESGKLLQEELVRRVRHYGMRMLGPNCLGLISTDPSLPINASFGKIFPSAGNVALSSDSGALGLATLANAAHRELGISSCVSVGNRADISSNDLLEYWEHDDRTGVILLYLESFGNPRRFAEIAKRVCRVKPIVALKAGRTSAGRRAAGSHTAAMATRDTAVDAMFHQTGVMRAETMEELFNLAAVLSGQPLPAGNRIGIVTNAGGPAILCADACESGGLKLPEFSPALVMRLAAFLPKAASVNNPVDMIASAGPIEFQRATTELLLSGEIDAMVVIAFDIGFNRAAEIDEAILKGVTSARIAGAKDQPVIVCRMPDPATRGLKLSPTETVPCVSYPEAAARVFSRLVAYSAWRKRPSGTIPEFPGADRIKARQICRNALQTRGPDWLRVEETRDVLDAMGLPIATGAVARSPDEAVSIARRLGFPVAMKVASSRIIHKTDVGGVRLKLSYETAVREAYESIRERFTRDGRWDAVEGMLIQPMVTVGTEVMVGMTTDASFGPLVAFGLGGIHVEILRDVVFRTTPITDNDAEEMIHTIRGYRLLEGYRGHPPADVSALRDVILRVAQLAEAVPEIVEMDLNPIFALVPGQGCRIVDARIRVRAAMGDRVD
jgi:acyl-CoA synthetase (NDP forming)